MSILAQVELRSAAHLGEKRKPAGDANQVAMRGNNICVARPIQ